MISIEVSTAPCQVSVSTTLSPQQFADVLAVLDKDDVPLHLLRVTVIVVQSLGLVRLFTSWTAACQASLSFTTSVTSKIFNGHDNQNSLKLYLISACVFYDQHMQLQEACCLPFMTHT